MRKLLSLQVGIPAIITLFLGGFAVIVPMPYITFTVWSIAFVWLIAMIIYQRQVVDIDIWKCGIENLDRNGNFDLVLEGDVKARHKDSLREIKLSTLERSFAPENYFRKKFCSSK